MVTIDFESFFRQNDQTFAVIFRFLIHCRPACHREKIGMLKEGFIIPFILAYPVHLQPLFDDETTLTVHSVYKNTINVSSHDRFIALQPTGLPTTPMSFSLDLNTESFARLTIKPGDLCRCDQTGLHVGGVDFEHRMARRFQCRLNDLHLTSATDYETAMLALESVLFTSTGNGQLLNAAQRVRTGEPDDSSLFGVIVHRVLTVLADPPDDESVINVTSRMIGLGEGLTPAGDDFLCGMLAAMAVMSNDPEIALLRLRVSQSIETHAHSTTKVSQSYLSCAVAGLFSSLTRDFFMAIHHQTECYRVLRDILSIGHSSGTDFLLGVYYGLKIGGNRNHDLQHD